MRSFRLVLTLALTLLGCFVSFSAPGPPSSGGSSTGTPGCWPPPCVPIDGGITFLIAAGAAYGAKKIYGSRKKTQDLR